MAQSLSVIPARHQEVSERALGRNTLEQDLARVVRGEVRFDEGSRALYATDGSNYRQPPIGVVVPLDVNDVIAAVDVCRAHDAPIFGRGGGTSLAGQCCNDAICIDMSKYMNRVLEIDAEKHLARVQPGTILDDLRSAAESFGLTFGPDPSTHNHCTLGGMIGNNSCGVHSVMAQFYGPGPRTSDSVESLDILTYEGVRMTLDASNESGREHMPSGRGQDIVDQLKALTSRYAEQIRRGIPDIPRRVSGYNLTALLPENGFNIAHAVVGSESTCVLILEATVRLIPSPKVRSLMVVGYPSIYEAADHIPDIMSFKPIGCEGMDHRLVKDIESVGYESDVLKLLPDGKGFLLVEFGGETKQDADDHANELIKHLQSRPNPPSTKLFDDPTEEKKVWAVREAGLGATAHVDRNRPTWEGWEDSSVPPDRLGEYLRAFRRLLDAHHLNGDLYGHFGQGCVHTRIDFDLQSEAGIRQYRAFVEQAADLVVSLGGSLSGEHGDGQSRGELLPRMFGPKLMDAFREFKRIWDPRWRMNPGKVIDAAPLDDHLRLGANYHPPALHTHFQFPSESGGFAKATLRCVGVGECRRMHGGTMCPSFKATREEKHSTRGRARLLFEMLEGNPLTGGWQNEAVKDALDLCLACKGCKHECPVSVDMATYKAEFLSHYYVGHQRPITAYAFGYIHTWAWLAATMPRTINTLLSMPGLGAFAKKAVGMAPARSIPRFAPTTFMEWFRNRAPNRVPGGGRRVMLWPDTFNNHFHPASAIAAVHVLERAGCAVEVPSSALCCGRPLYDYGFLNVAGRWLRRILHALRATIAEGIPIVVLEPSCAAVFRDEMVQLMPGEPDAARLRDHTFTLGEFLHKIGSAPPHLRRKALVHGHCHHKSVLDFSSDVAMLNAMGVEADVLDSGCCGMAGSFGFEAGHYDISVAIGEQVLLPAVRSASKDTLIVADGFSCREQIAQCTGRVALHLADVLDMAAGPLVKTT